MKVRRRCLCGETAHTFRRRGCLAPSTSRPRDRAVLEAREVLHGRLVISCSSGMIISPASSVSRSAARPTYQWTGVRRVGDSDLLECVVGLERVDRACCPAAVTSRPETAELDRRIAAAKVLARVSADQPKGASEKWSAVCPLRYRRSM